MCRSTNGIQGMGGMIMLLGWKSPITEKDSARDMQLSNLCFLSWNHTRMVINTNTERLLPLVKHICSLDCYMSVLDNIQVYNPIVKHELKI